MMKKYLVFFLAVGLTLQITGCTSGSKEGGDEASQQQNDQQFSQEGEGDFAQQDAGGGQDQLQLDGQGQDGGKMADQSAPQDASQELALDAQQSKGGDELSLEDPQPLPENVAGTDPAAQKAPEPMPPTDGGAPVPMDNAQNPAPAPAPTDEPLFKNETAGASGDAGAAPGTDVAVAAPAPKVIAPLQKIKSSSFENGGANLNRVYLARASDKSLKAVSQKIYGNDRAKDLKKWNPSVGNKPKVGTKIYYQSATNPEDTKMMTYYEEMGVQPQLYTTQEGDNIRKLSKNWLGSSESWKEVWSTNLDVEPKGDLPAGLQLKYWPEEAVAQGKAGGETMAQAPTNPLPSDLPPPPPMPEMNPAPPAGGGMAANEPPPGPPPPAPPQPASTPDSGMPVAGQVAPPPPPEQVPPPPPPPVAPPPEPKPVAKNKAKAEPAEDPDATMALGLAGILIMAAAVLFVVLRKNRAKRVDLSQTQV